MKTYTLKCDINHKLMKKFTVLLKEYIKKYTEKYIEKVYKWQ